ncbi:MAG: sporulation protein YunB [Clostridia bacterium]|nr:sporulation protein YunB [Clostridia bacterium]
MDKIYSRPRIRIKNPRKMTKKQKFKFIIYFILVVLFIFTIFVIKSAYPIFVASCRNSASSIAINILNQEVNEVMLQYNYNDLVNIQKDLDGNVSYIEARIMPINEIIGKITNNIQNKLDQNSMISVKLNFGSISGISALSVISPQFKIALERAGNIETEIKSEFTSVGINQTLHRIYLNLTCTVDILTPFESIGKSITSQVLLTETVIVGTVPDTYYNYDNLGFEDVLNTLR